MPLRGGGEPADGFAERVIRWQRRHGRHDLPWQGTRDPYRVWLSEIMLQQTQVSTVLAYYERFLQRFPDLQALAAAPQDEVLAAWSGLGYYSRARNLHRCALVLVAEHGGRFPEGAAALATLPGIGRSTAAAIAAFCHGERVAILDGNVKRVLARALGFADDLAGAAAQRRLWDQAEALLPARGIEAYTQGLMDLGAGVCSVRAPHCEACPLAPLCVARQQGRPQDYPLKTRRTHRSHRRNGWLWLAHRGQVWLVKRPERGVWAGLWSLPEYASADEAEAALAGTPGQAERLPVVEHALTHFDWTLEPLRWELPSRIAPAQLSAAEATVAAGRWFTTDEALALGLPAPLRKLLSAEPR